MGKVITRKEKETKKNPMPPRLKKIASELKQIERQIWLEEFKQSELEKRAQNG